MSDPNETSGLSSAGQMTDSTGAVTLSPDNTSSDIVEIILTLLKREKSQKSRENL
nr:hypothetical protein [Candidatus Njordarchaeota archaeon]